MKLLAISSALSLMTSVFAVTGVGTKCHADGLGGICQETSSFCEGWYRAGHCPGPANVNFPVENADCRFNVALRRIANLRSILMGVLGPTIQDALVPEDTS